MASASDLERGKCFEYKGEILSVVKKELVNCGTHSHTKLKLTVKDLNGKRERQVTFAHNDKIEIIDVVRKTANVVSKTVNGLQIMDEQSYETLDAECEPDILETLTDGDAVIYLNINNRIKILSKKFV